MKMNSYNKVHSDSITTPKRRRLGIRKIIPKNQSLTLRKNAISTPLSSISSNLNINNRCESPPLPCNQVQYLCDSPSNCSVTSEIPCTPNAFETCFLKDIENWDSFISPKNKDTSKMNCSDELNDTILPKLDVKLPQVLDTNLTTTCEKLFRDEIDESFNLCNQSILNIDNNYDKSFLFETKDSFLLDIRESGLINNENNCESDHPKSKINQVFIDPNRFYGLPTIVRGLFKTYRNIEKFYEWQEECLNLEAIRERRNLIYALPTSGGKTLVAEVLMLREVLNRKKNALFILPFVAIVQEKIWSLAPFALQLDFLVEEYAAGKGHIPPKKRRKKNSIYIATIEKGLALIRSLIELDRLDEIGLIVVDELHLIGESGRGGSLEMLLTTVIFANKGIQIVGMSATIGNLPDIAKFLKADIYEKQFRPVELTEYVKLGKVLHKIVWGSDGMEIIPDRELSFDYSPAGLALDPDMLGGLVSEVCPRGSCLIFCPTKRNCENVAALLCKVLRKDMLQHRAADRAVLCRALVSAGAGGALERCARAGVAFHHAGLAADERSLLEHAYRSGVISVICCTSTLAAGVNLPARRVVVRAPQVGRAPLSLATYKQMAGRAGRAGVCEAGESILLCSAAEWARVRTVLAGALPPARSALAAPALLLSAAALRLADTRSALAALLRGTLLAVSPPDGTADIEQVCDEAIRSLLENEALEIVNGTTDHIDDDTQFAVSKLGRAAIEGCMDLSVAKRLLEDFDVASRSLVLIDSLHLLFLVTPHDSGIKPDYRHYYSLYCELDEEGVQTAKILGITEVNAIRMMTGKPITNVPESVLCRFYLALMLRDLWRQMPFPAVAEKYSVSRGALQSVMSGASSFAASASRLCASLPALWAFRALLEPLAQRLQYCAAPGLDQLMQLPAVRKARAMQLVRAGYKRVEDVARASADKLSTDVPHLSRSAADHLVSSARMMLIEKVENLRAEAEDVMEELQI